MKANWKNIAILGAGESGVGAALLANKHGLNVYLSDSGTIKPNFASELAQAGIEAESGGHNLDKLSHADIVVKSPGIPGNISLVEKLKSMGKTIISEIEFAYHFTNATIIAISGSNGKTTTTALCGHVLQRGGLSVGVGGNIGKSFARLLAEEEEKDHYVLEVSSFQCDDLMDFHPHICIITNISPDHLDRYNYEVEAYVAAKFKLLKNMTPRDHFIFFVDDDWTQKMIDKLNPKCHLHGFGPQRKKTSNAWINEDKTITIDINGDTMNIEHLALKGQHNANNSMASSLAARLLKVRKESIRDSLTNFDALEHRLESVGSIRGVNFINDSKATNVNSTYYALESVSKPIIWIAGGVDKGNDYTELMPLVQNKVKAIVCLGLDNQKLLEEFTGQVKVITETRDMERAVKMAFSLSEKGDTVLLSPACASFDLFNNYEHRGEEFKYWIRQL
ncbi:MAG: UDP-N-acetylmuramoyl-L-alanine--D-glutamate ligase [Cryomorphaceae bacterium]|nr:UDP-N-acetylmuramoyl-L-alanine--D-glutamate ligase [Cryomorphaceae bacterium]